MGVMNRKVINMEQKVFELPVHPVTKKKQQIVVERPSEESVWMLVLEKDKAIPLVHLEEPTNPKVVLEAAEKQQGEGWMIWFCGNGFSQV